MMISWLRRRFGATVTETDEEPAAATTDTPTEVGEDDSNAEASSEADEGEGEGEEVTVSYDPSASPPTEATTRQRRVVGPSTLEPRPGAVRAGTDWTQTLWIGEFPDMPTDGLFETLYAAPETRRTDITLHIDPRETQATLDGLENQIEDLESDFEYLADRRRAGARGVKKDLNDHRDLYDVLRNTSVQAFDVAMLLTTRHDDPERIDAGPVRRAARQSPANLTPITPRWAQLDALVSASPIGLNQLDTEFDTTTPMLAGAVSAMFPFVAGTVAEQGIEYGTYALNESPLILDRFNRETGYCMMVIGKLGAGKSFSTKLHLVRRAMYDAETRLVLLDPLGGFERVRDVLGGERITVGGTRGLNPLELRATPDDIRREVTDLDPWAEQITWALAFFEAFFDHVAANPLGERKQTLRRAVQDAYARQGITRDPATHDNPSPTIRDVIAVLEDLLADPAQFGYATPGEQERVQTDAQSLLTDLRPSFRPDGDLANLAEPTSLNLDSDVLYLDLQQEEGLRGQSRTSLMMQVLFNSVYEHAKGTDKRVVFVIDEAHYLLNETTSLEFLETAVRHSRHYDLSVQFITQTGGEFTLTPEAQTIANLCSITLIHRVREEMDTLADWFGLNAREQEWVRTAKAGNEDDGYSEALLGVDEEGWFPLRIRASEFEQRVIDGEEEPLG